MPRTMEEASVSWSKGRPVGSRWRATAIPSTRSEWRADFSAYPGILHPARVRIGPAERSRGRPRPAQARPAVAARGRDSSVSGQRPRDFELTQREPRKPARSRRDRPANVDPGGSRRDTCKSDRKRPRAAARQAQGERREAGRNPAGAARLRLVRAGQAAVLHAHPSPRRLRGNARPSSRSPAAGGEAGASGAPGTKDTENMRAKLEPDPLAGVRQPASRSTPDRGALALRHRIRLARRAGPADFHVFPFPFLRGSHGQ